MATVNIKFFRPSILEGGSAIIGIDVATPEVFTSSGTSQPTTASAPDDRTVARIVSSGGDVWITTGASPTAVTSEGTLILDGIPEYIELPYGYKIALID